LQEVCAQEVGYGALICFPHDTAQATHQSKVDLQKADLMG